MTKIDKTNFRRCIQENSYYTHIQCIEKERNTHTHIVLYLVIVGVYTCTKTNMYGFRAYTVLSIRATQIFFKSPAKRNWRKKEEITRKCLHARRRTICWWKCNVWNIQFVCLCYWIAKLWVFAIERINTCRALSRTNETLYLNH